MRRWRVFLLIYFALAGLAHGQANLNAPRLFELGMNALTGIGPGRDDMAAMENFRRSADLAYPPAQVVLGYLYETGSIVAAQPGAAVEWYKKAAKQDDRVGDWLLGRMYFTGSGVARDLSLAQAALQKAANQGDPFGQYLLGMVLLERNQYAQAGDWFRKAAVQGLPQAQQQLGLLLKQGQGVPLNKFDAYVWLLVSYDGGNQTATVASNLAALQADLGSTQVEQAKFKARDLEQTTNRVVVARGCTGWQGEFSAIPAPPPPDIQRFCR
ncbi:MAG TPA: tetratricopeptide repeat protein [Terriglobales bacterium]